MAPSRSRMPMSDSPTDRWKLARLWVSGTDRARIALPRPLVFLYHILRLPLLVSRLGKRLFSRLGG